MKWEDINEQTEEKLGPANSWKDDAESMWYWIGWSHFLGGVVTPLTRNPSYMAGYKDAKGEK
jgi:hypothetical protein